MRPTSHVAAAAATVEIYCLRVCTLDDSRCQALLALGNTTITRPPTLREAKTAQETGGLSGKPLFELSTKMLGAAYLRVEGRFPLIGAGGIDGPDSAFAKMEAGASLIQLYSSMVFKGAGLPGEILRGLTAKLDEQNLSSIKDVVGRRARDWAGDLA